MLPKRTPSTCYNNGETDIRILALETKVRRLEGKLRERTSAFAAHMALARLEARLEPRLAKAEKMASLALDVVDERFG